MRIPVSSPVLNGNEKKYVLDCLESNWISSHGKYIASFEHAFASFCGVNHALSCSNGTVALHLALEALGIGPGDEVIVPTLTYVACANAVRYVGATPRFVDSDPDHWTIDVNHLKTLINSRTRAIMPVHLYGHPADMEAINKIASQHGLFVIEDAAEAHGARIFGRRVGSIGHIATFSFFGNKVITTGEGGMVTTNDDQLAARVLQLKSQGQDPNRRYWFPILGYNYRMTNIQAAIGLAQLEDIDWHLECRQRISDWYDGFLSDQKRLQLPVEMPWAKKICWLYCVVFRDISEEERDLLILRLAEAGVDTRPFFYPMHTLPGYQAFAEAGAYPVAERLARSGINLPTGSGMDEEAVRFVSKTLIETSRQVLR